MLLGPLSTAFGVMANPIPRGCIELPAAYGEHIWGMFKGTHKYLKRVPIGTTSTGKTKYRYYYNVGHGGGIDSHEHMIEGAKFAHGEGHFHIVKQDGDKLHVRNTATGEDHTITKQALAQKLAEHHAEGLKAYRDRAAKALAEAKANKASPKQIARLEERVKRAGGDHAESEIARRAAAKEAEMQALSERFGVKILPASELKSLIEEHAKAVQSNDSKGADLLRRKIHQQGKLRHQLENKRDAERFGLPTAAPAPKETLKVAPESKPSAEHMDKVKTMRVSQLEWPANNPRHPMHEAAKAELERREKLVTPKQAIEITRKALDIERRQADGGEAGRRARTTQADEAALEAFSALTPKQKKTAMDALHSERH